LDSKEGNQNTNNQQKRHNFVLQWTFLQKNQLSAIKK
jgi:hypothetical protein